MRIATSTAPRAPGAAFTLVELVVVVVVIAVVATLVVVSTSSVVAQASIDGTRSSLASLREAIVGRAGFVASVTRAPDRIGELFTRPPSVPAFDPRHATGWRGPYARGDVAPYALALERGFVAEYGAPGEPVPIDAWSNPIVLQVPDVDGDGIRSALEREHARLVSAGPDGVVQTPRTGALAQAPGDALFPSLAQCADDLVLYVFAADRRP